MHLCVFEDDQAHHFLPLVHTRAVYDLRLGIRTLLRAQRDAFGDPPTILHARRVVAAVTGLENDLLVNRIPDGLDVLFVNGRWVVEDGDVIDRVRGATGDRRGRVFVHQGDVVAAWVPAAANRLVEADVVVRATFEGLPEEELADVRLIRRLWSFQDELHDALVRDFRYYSRGLLIYERPGVDVRDGAILARDEEILIEPGAVIRPGAVLNAETGPIYIGKNVVVHELAVIKGPAYVGPRSVINTGADIDTCSFGYFSKVGGHVEETIIHSLSNKAHDGFLGNAYLGRWCNLGADTNASNLRNDYGEIRMYDAVAGDFEPTGRQFLGLVMGDHSKSAISTMFNTAAVVGVSCNVLGSDFQPRFIPSFSWGGPKSFDEYRVEKALRVARDVMQRRDRDLSEAECENLEAVYSETRGEVVRF